jgi:hypothetical protein
MLYRPQDKLVRRLDWEVYTGAYSVEFVFLMSAFGCTWKTGRENSAGFPEF